MDRLFTLSEAAEMLHVHIKTIQRWDRQGLVYCPRIMGRRRVPESEVMAILSGECGAARKATVLAAKNADKYPIKGEKL